MHAKAGHHVASDVGRFVQVVGRTSGRFIEDEHLCRPAAQQNGQSVF
jgi:hypothetical protein